VPRLCPSPWFSLLFSKRTLILTTHVAFDSCMTLMDDIPARLCRHLAQKCPEEGPGSAKRKKEFDEQKCALVAALAAKVKALLDMEDAATFAAALWDKAGLGAAAKAAVEGAEGGGKPDGDGGGGGAEETQQPSPKLGPAPGTTTLAAAAAELQAEAGAEAGAADIKEPAEDDATEQAFRCAHREPQLLIHETGDCTGTGLCSPPQLFLCTWRKLTSCHRRVQLECQGSHLSCHVSTHLGCRHHAADRQAAA
jgi:hypothetical protein